MRGAKLLGIYRNNPDTAEEAIVVSDVGLFLALRDRAIFVDFQFGQPEADAVLARRAS